MPKEKTLNIQVKEARQQVELAALRAELRSIECSLTEAWGTVVDPRERYGWGDDTFSLAAFVQRDDFSRGRCRPIYESELDLQKMWATARYLRHSDAAGSGFMRCLTDFAIGTGMTYECRGADGEIVRPVQAILDAWQESVDWTGEMEREIFIEAETHGDAFAWLAPQRIGLPGLELLAPEWVTEPASPPPEDWAFGLDWLLGAGSQPNRSTKVEGYFASVNGNPADYEAIQSCQMMHFRRNAPRWAKRGISTFFPAMTLLEKASKLLGNALEGGAIQAAIAFIREHAPGVTSSQAQSMQASKATSTGTAYRSDGSSYATYQRRFTPGTVLDVGSGQKYHAGPMGTPSGPIYIEIVQAALRVAGATRGIPEYMISGDSSNANYASTLVAGSPFVRSIQHLQMVYSWAFRKLMWKVLEAAVVRGMLAKNCIFTKSDLRAACDVVVTPTQVVLANPKEDEEIRAIRASAGVLSKRTWQKQVDLDPDEEAANMEAEPSNLVLPAAFSQSQPAATTPVSQPSGGTTEGEEALNGAQVTAALDVMEKVVAGTLAPNAAITLLMSVRIPEAKARAMVAEQMKVAKPAVSPQPPPPSQPEQQVNESVPWWRCGV